jgi:hypothetical protein
MPKLRPPADILEELEHRRELVRVYEAPIRKEGKHHLEGLQEAQTIWVYPRPAIVEVILHELLHVQYPGWSEKRVNREGRRLLTALDEQGVNRWYRWYTKARRVSKRRVGLDED